MQKDFNLWNNIKKQTEESIRNPYAHPREIWWCSLGVNIGAEIDGKNEQFERPVLVMRVYNKETLLVVPITSKQKQDRFHFPVTIKTSQPDSFKEIFIKLTQVRVISNKRLIRKVDVIPEEIFSQIRNALKDFI